MKIGIIGGTSGLGETLALLLKDEFKITISGRNHSKGYNLAKKLKINYCESNKELAKENDIVIISVPINFTEEVIREVANSMKKGSLMIDVTSVKENPSKIMNEFLSDDVEFIPTHPIFGPRTRELDNQVIVLTPIKKGKWYPKIMNYLKNKNMRVLETTSQKHDYMMSIVQVLTHFSYISTASAIEKLKVNIKDTEDFESPIYNLMIDMIARIVSQNPYLTYYIQTENNNGNHIRNTFYDAVLELKDTINNKNEKKFVEIANKATKNMRDIQGALGRSDKAINSLNHEFNLLCQSKNKEIGLRNIYSGEIYNGILKEINHDNLILKENGNVKQLKISNIEVLTDEELDKWKMSTKKIITESIICIFNNKVDEKIIKNTLINLKNIVDVKIINTKERNENKTKIIFKISGLNEKDINNAKKLLNGFGVKTINSNNTKQIF